MRVMALAHEDNCLGLKSQVKCTLGLSVTDIGRGGYFRLERKRACHRYLILLQGSVGFFASSRFLIDRGCD